MAPARGGYQIPKPINVMLSASQPKSPMAIIVSRLVVESGWLSDGCWEDFTASLQWQWVEVYEVVHFASKDYALPPRRQGECKDCEEKDECWLKR